MGSRRTDRDRPSCDDSAEVVGWASNYPDWQLNVFCTECGHSVQASPKRLLDLRNPPHTLGEVRQRLTCTRCLKRAVLLTARFAGKRRD